MRPTAASLRPASPTPPPLKAVLLDMDGVLVDVRGSYRRAITETVAHFAGEGPTPAQIQAKKTPAGSTTTGC